MQAGYAASYPLMVTPGNHESERFNYSQYTARFAGLAAHAGANSGSGSAHYYSFDVGIVHVVAFSTEVYWSSPGQVESQLNWLKRDLAKANANRAAVPWVVAMAHKSYYMDTTYCANTPSTTDCYSNSTWFDDLLHEGGADIYFVGHMHECVGAAFSPAFFPFPLIASPPLSPLQIPAPRACIWHAEPHGSRLHLGPRDAPNVHEPALLHDRRHWRRG